jgi:RND family efflux transporter MFP subunit
LAYLKQRNKRFIMLTYIRTHWKKVAIALSVIVIVLLITGKSSVPVATETMQKPEVTVASVSELQKSNTFSVVGTVSAVSEAKLETEAGGRVTAVNVAIGDRVSAGSVLASIENSAESAQLLQAEGMYESALAGSSQSEASFDEAKVSVRNAYRDTFSTTDSIITSTIDDFFTKNPGLRKYGLRLTGVGLSSETIVDNRMAIDPMMELWSKHVSTNFEGVTEDAMLAHAESTITAISNLAVVLATSVADRENEERYTDVEEASYTAELTSVRASLDSALATISQTRGSFEQARLTVEKGTVSQSNAQVKSALGTLRSAQANYEKTLVRTPISGVVNALYLKAGEYTSVGQPAALVANNGSLEVSTALGEDDLDTIKLGDTVTINDNATGTITKIAPAIDPLSGKLEVKISIDDALLLKNGSTVSVSFSRQAEVTIGAPVIIPISALKLLPSGPITFSVNAEGKLDAQAVTIGEILGETVQILTGLTSESVIVRDARGLIFLCILSGISSSKNVSSAGCLWAHLLSLVSYLSFQSRKNQRRKSLYLLVLYIPFILEHQRSILRNSSQIKLNKK